MNKLVIIGLDGATFDVLNPLIEQDYLPNIKNLMEKGIFANLTSTIPPITGPAWLALATGLAPGKTGIIDFLNRRDEGWNLKSVTSNDFKGRAFWDYLSDSGYKIDVFNYPMLIPPYPINGVMVSGIGASVNHEFTYPSSIKKELIKKTDGYQISINYMEKKYDDEDKFIKDAETYLSKQKKAIGYLLGQNKSDVFIGVVSLSDWLQHLFWKHWDANCPYFDPQRSPKYKREFIRLWGEIDQFIKDIIDIATDDSPSEANVFIVSDHGFGIQDKCFNLARWLVEHEYMVLKGVHKKEAKAALYKMANRLKPLVPNVFRRMAGKHIIGLKPKITDLIDFDKSKAFCLGHTIPFGAIYINNHTGHDHIYYSKLKDEILEKLSCLGSELGREDIEVQFHLPDRLYNGNAFKFLPDIMFTINNWSSIVDENNVTGPLFINGPFSRNHTGSHRLNGIFIASGPLIKSENKRIDDINICDVFPTILYSLGHTIPENDGRVINEIFRKEIKQKRATSNKDKGQENKTGSDNEEEERIREQLKGLGYL